MKQHKLAFLSEAMLFVAYFASLLCLATLRTPLSNWALVPHLLCNAGLLMLFIKHRAEGRPSMYWSHFDLLIILLFVYIAAGVQFSEIPAVSWRSAAMYMDAMCAYFFGRMLFYHRLRTYAMTLSLALVVGYVIIGIMRQGIQDGPDAAPILNEQLLKVQRVLLLVGVFWLVSTPFLFFKKPQNLPFLAYTALLLVLYSVLVAKRLGWILEPLETSNRIQIRHDKFETLQTAWRIIRNYPLFGSGLGTFPFLFEVYREHPGIPYVASFNAYMYGVVEIGLIGAILLLYLFIRMPLHVMRRWRLFPNRRLRMAVFIFLAFSLLIFLQGFYDADTFSPIAWFLIWTNVGIFMSLVMIRDSVRIFDMLFYASEYEYVDEGVTDDKSAMGKKVLGLPLAPRPGAIAALPWRDIFPISFVTILVTALTIAEAAPYAAGKLARLREGEVAGSPQYGQRLGEAARIFPFDSQIWKKLAKHYSERVSNPLDVYAYKKQIEEAYKRAVVLNPYDTGAYESLFYVYRDTNDWQQALQTLKSGVANNPNHFVLRMLLVRELERMGSYALATYHVKHALLRISPESVELYLRLAELYDARGMRDQARLYYNYARQVVPENAQTALRLRRLSERLRAS